MHYYRVYGAAGLVLHAVNGQLCAGKQYAEQIDLIRASGRPLTISFRQPRAKETYAVPKQVGEGAASKTADQAKKVQRPVPQKKPAHADESSAATSPLPSSVKSSTSDSPSAFKQPRASGQLPEEGVPPVRQKDDCWQATCVLPCMSGCWLTNLDHDLRVAGYPGAASVHHTVPCLTI